MSTKLLFFSNQISNRYNRVFLTAKGNTALSQAGAPSFRLISFPEYAIVGFYSQQKKSKEHSVFICKLNYAAAFLCTLDVNSTDTGLGSLNDPQAI